jgi:hypothetical protein
MDETWWKEARLVAEWFKRQGPRYQSRINAALRAFMEARRIPGRFAGERRKRRARRAR